jgi:hypothetical protein
MPAEVSDLLAALNLRVAHIGRDEPYLVPAPAKGTPDAVLRNAARQFVLMTLDQRLLRPGSYPNNHVGIVVIDASEASALQIVRGLLGRANWLTAPVMRNRRLLVSRNHLDEVGRDGTITRRIW